MTAWLAHSSNYGLFLLVAAGYLSVQHIRRPYAVVQANSLPDFLVFAALVPKLLGCRVVAFVQEPTPELAETLLGRKWLTRFLSRIEQWSIRFADHSLTVTEELKGRYVERGASADRITVVLNCADPDNFLGNWSPPPLPAKSWIRGCLPRHHRGSLRSGYDHRCRAHPAR